MNFYKAEMSDAELIAELIMLKGGLFIYSLTEFDSRVIVETVVKLSLKKIRLRLKLQCSLMKRVITHQKRRLLIKKIKDYVKEKYGVNVHTSYIAQVKRMCGLEMGENYNKLKKQNLEVKQYPQEKVKYIKDALRHYREI